MTRGIWVVPASSDRFEIEDLAAAFRLLLGNDATVEVQSDTARSAESELIVTREMFARASKRHSGVEGNGTRVFNVLTKERNQDQVGALGIEVARDARGRAIGITATSLANSVKRPAIMERLIALPEFGEACLDTLHYVALHIRSGWLWQDD